MRREQRILITDAEQRGVLAACRGLAAADYRVSAVAEQRFAVGHWSRSLEKRIKLPGPKTDPEGYVERLLHVLRNGEYDMVLPGSDLSLLPISERRHLIEPYARLGLPPHEVLLRALDKPFLHSKAAAVGLAPPRSVTFASQEEALAAAKDFAFPLIVKPVRSVTWTADQMNEQMALVVEDATHLKDAVVTVGAPLTLQEYVHAASIVSCAAVRAEGLLLGLTFVRYARTHPLENGDAAMATTIAAPRLLTDQVQQLLDLIGWCGIFELELLDLGEERFAAIDLNPRPFGWMSLPIGAGANLPALWCDHVLRRHSVSAQVARVGIHYRWADADIRNALTLLRRGHLRSTVAALRPHRRVVHPHFRLDDPGPAVARMGFAAEKMISQRRSILGGARIRARGSNQSAHDPQKPCKDA